MAARMPRSIRTERLILRRWQRSDLALCAEMDQDAEVQRYRYGSLMSPEDREQAILRAIDSYSDPDPPGYPFAVVVAETGKFVGSFGINVSTEHRSGGEIYYALARSAWGHGYATEAAAALLEFGFRKLRLHRIVACCHPDNQASANVMVKVGMSYEGRLRDHILGADGWRDSLVYSILEHEWPPGSLLRPEAT